jgi:hypothetical protein
LNTATIELERQTAEALQRQATARGLPLGAYLRQVAEMDGDFAGDARGELISAAAFDAMLDEFFTENPRSVPALPPQFSRSDIYGDHD